MKKIKNNCKREGIWRCYHGLCDSLPTVCWEAREYRREKKQANPDDIIRQIQVNHDYPYNGSDLLQLWDNTIESTRYYQTRNIVDFP